MPPATSTVETQSGTSQCAEGGSISGSGSGSESNGEATVSYDACCVAEACCMDGNAHIFYSSDQNAPYMYCASYDMTYDCDGTSAALEFEGCISSDGEQVYVLEVNGNTYTVSGYYSEGSGSLEIRGANGSWTCTYSGSGGTCTGSGGNFEF